MDLDSFVETRRPSWKRLELLVAKLETHGARVLAEVDGGVLSRRRLGLDAPPGSPSKGERSRPDDVAAGDANVVVGARELAALYRQACADLIRARSETANSELIGYLNGLVGRAYGVIYRGPRFRLVAALRFALVSFPRRVRARWGHVAAAAAVFFAGVAFAWVAEAADPAAKHYLLPPEMASLEDKIASSPAAVGGTAMPPGMNALFSSQIMSNNIFVSIRAFALGGTAGIGTASELFYNGVLLGGLASIFHRHHLAEGFWALIVPHGVIELTAIFVAGGAGFLIARALVAPGEMGRRAALARLGLEAVELAVGCALLLVVAGLIEGFVTPQPGIPAGAKIGFGALTGVGLLVFFVWNEDLLEPLGLLERLGVAPEAHVGPLRRPGDDEARHSSG